VAGTTGLNRCLWRHLPKAFIDVSGGCPMGLPGEVDGAGYDLSLAALGGPTERGELRGDLREMWHPKR